MSFFNEISARLAALSGSATPVEALESLNEFDVRDIQAVRVSEGGGGGSQSVKHVVVPVEYTDIDTATGIADLYLLLENETILFSWSVVTTTFNGAPDGGSHYGGVQVYPPGGSVGTGSSGALSDSFDVSALASAGAVEGIIGPTQEGPGNATTLMMPMAAPTPGSGDKQIVIDFVNSGSAEGLPCTQGSQGHLDYHLVLAVAS